MTKTCSQCGAVLPSSVRVCNFCDSAFFVGFSSPEEFPTASTRGNLALNADSSRTGTTRSGDFSTDASESEQGDAWRGELAQRLEVYRTRRRKATPNDAQSQFRFEERAEETPAHASAAVAEPPPPAQDDFSFSIAIGCPSKQRVLEEAAMVIDVSLPPDTESGSQAEPVGEKDRAQPGLHPVALMDDRRLAGVIDLCCLLFAYGGFLALFSSLGGQFTLSKLSAAVYTATFAIVYLQYFALFTIFGGTTPGMMMRGLEVVSFSGELPTPRQMLLRSAGYVLSAGTLFLGFLWAMWDEDELTWHDRLSRTYLSAAETFADLQGSSIAHSR